MDHFDGHCLRAYSYFSDKMPDITQELKEHPEKEVEIINSIKTRYKHLRQLSKGPSFCLTYAGSHKALMEIFGFSKEEALNIERKYHELYKESDEWVQNKLQEAARNGYLTGAFGLRVRTPMLKQSLLGKKVTPQQVATESRTGGNFLGQSFCCLTTRAGVEFHKRTREEGYASKIIPINQIHDALYFLVKNDADTILWLNKWLVKAVQWQDDPAIYHDKVKLGGNLSIFYPDWANEYEIPNECTKEQLFEICKGDK